MNELPPGQDVCPVCGWTRGGLNEAHELSPGSVLAGKYMLGRALGQGGFGITYIAWDLLGERRVAIKEYYPSSNATRQLDRYTVCPFTGSGSTEAFEKGRAKFSEEARKLTQFGDVSGIVSAYDFFEENGTAYIVMEYLEGRTLKEELNARGKPMSVEEALNVLTPVCEALEAVHAAGFIHRDISPDNIMLTPDGAKLLDFGAARAFSLQGERSNTVNVKMGYAPQEQYNVHGRQGTWTDVYALAATLYRCVTGRVPEQCYDRAPKDTLTPPRELVRSITRKEQRAILNGMAMDHRARTQTVREFMDALGRPLPAPQYSTRSDLFIGGDAKTVAITGDLIDPRLLGINDAAKRASSFALVLSLILSAVGAVLGILSVVCAGTRVSDPSLLGTSPDLVRGLLTAFMIFQIVSVLLMVPTVLSALGQLKGSVRPRYGLLQALRLVTCALVPEILILVAVIKTFAYDGGGHALLLLSAGFAVTTVLADLIVFRLPFGHRPRAAHGESTAPRKRLLAASAVCLIGTVLGAVAAAVGIVRLCDFFRGVPVYAELGSRLNRNLNLLVSMFIALQAEVFAAAPLLAYAVKRIYGGTAAPGKLRPLRVAVAVCAAVPEIVTGIAENMPLVTVLAMLSLVAQPAADWLACGMPERREAVSKQ